MEAETIEDDIGEEGFPKKQIEEVKQKLWIENSTKALDTFEEFS